MITMMVMIMDMSILIHLWHMFVKMRVDYLLFAVPFPPFVLHYSILHYWPFEKGYPAVPSGQSCGKGFYVITSSCSVLFNQTEFFLKGHGSRITKHSVICVYEKVGKFSALTLRIQLNESYVHFYAIKVHTLEAAVKSHCRNQTTMTLLTVT